MPLFSILPVANVQSSKIASPFTMGVLEKVQLENFAFAPFSTVTVAPFSPDFAKKFTRSIAISLPDGITTESALAYPTSTVFGPWLKKPSE